MEYTDQSDQWHTGVANSMTFDVTVKKRSFTVVQPEPVAEGQDHFWIPQIKDNETGGSSASPMRQTAPSFRSSTTVMARGSKTPASIGMIRTSSLSPAPIR